MGDARGRDALRDQVAVGVGRWRPQHVGDRVGGEAVDLLGHGPVARAQPRFQMDGGDAELDADQRRGDGRIDVADHDQPVGPVRSSATFSYSIITRPVCAPWLPEPTPRWKSGVGQAEIAEDRVRHVGVVMLAGMDQDRREVGRGGERVPERRHLHEIGTRGGDQMDGLGGQIGLLGSLDMPERS